MYIALLLASMCGQLQFNNTEQDAVVWAIDALAKYDTKDQPFIRFIWIPPWGDAEWAGVVDFAVNAAASQARTIHLADRHANGWMLAYNLQFLASGPELARLVEVWDELAIRDPYFHVPDVNTVQIECKRCGGTGKIRSSRSLHSITCPDCHGTGKVSGANPGVAILAPHLSDVIAKNAVNAERSERIDVLVTQLTKSTGGIYRADWFLEQLLTSIRGKYAEFRQIEFEKQGVLTPFQAHVKRRGFSFEESLQAGGEKAAWLKRSGVTGKERVVAAVFGLGSITPMTVTFDFLDQNVKPNTKFIRNLINFNAFSDGSEAFVPLKNGLVEYILADGQGNLLRVAPPNLVADSTKPDGHTKELEIGMSCIICHHPNNGYRTAKNDFDAFFGSGVDFFGEDISVQGKRLSKQEAVDTVAARFGEGLASGDGVLARARRDYELTIGRIVKYEVRADGPTPTQMLGAKIMNIYHTYRYSLVTSQVACLELGVAGGNNPNEVLQNLTSGPLLGDIEDPLIPAMWNGLAVTRDDFEAIYGEMARRATLNRKVLKQ